jgi:hypothetical protein
MIEPRHDDGGPQPAQQLDEGHEGGGRKVSAAHAQAVQLDSGLAQLWPVKSLIGQADHHLAHAPARARGDEVEHALGAAGAESGDNVRYGRHARHDFARS